MILSADNPFNTCIFFVITEASLSENVGFLSSLVGEGCECHGYKIRIVGHSLGGAVGTMLGIRVNS